jgi:hypothetical protein
MLGIMSLMAALVIMAGVWVLYALIFENEYK